MDLRDLKEENGFPTFTQLCPWEIVLKIETISFNF